MAQQRALRLSELRSTFGGLAMRLRLSQAGAWAEKEMPVERGLNMAGRVLIAALFAAGATQKFVDPDAVRGLLIGAGLPPLLVWPAALFDAVAAICLVTGPGVQWWALMLAAYCMATSFFHLIPSDPWQISIFVKNWAIAGGLLVLASQRRA